MRSSALQNNRFEAIISLLRCIWMFLRQGFLSLIDFISEWTSASLVLYGLLGLKRDPAYQNEMSQKDLIHYKYGQVIESTLTPCQGCAGFTRF